MPRPEVFDRVHVLDSAKQVFWLKGYNGTSMQDLVDATGLNRSSIYNSFGSKMELYQEVLAHYQKESDVLFQMAKEGSQGSLSEIRKIFEIQVEGILQDTDRKGCMTMNCGMEMGNQEKDLGKWVAANQEQLTDYFRGLIEAGQQAGEIAADRSSADLANYLVVAFQGMRITGTSLQDRKALRQIIKNIIFTLQ